MKLLRAQEAEKAKIFVRRDRVLWTKKALEPLAFIFVVCS